MSLDSEENDWCQRAIAEGYKNLHVTNLFVYHKHGGSFVSEEKQRLIESNSKILNSRYPTYETQVQALISENKLDKLRKIIALKVLCESKISHFIIDHSLGGGANHYADKMILDYLNAGDLVCLLKYDFRQTKQYLIEFKYDKDNFLFKSSSISGLYDFASSFKFKNVFVNSLVSFPEIGQHLESISQLKNTNQDIRLIVPIHDFFPVCPNYTLLDETGTYCEVPKDLKKCSRCLKKNEGEFKIFEKTTNIHGWRESWNTLLDLSDEVLCFSNSSKKIFLKAYPLYKEKTTVIPHDISGRYTEIYKPRENKQELRIAILGGINEAKGAKVVDGLVKHIDNNGLKAKVILIGEISIPIASLSFEMTGRYDKNDLEKIVKEREIDIFLIPSVCPETFSYTTDEIMQMGYPIIVFDLGAPAERVRNYKYGHVIQINELYDTLNSYAEVNLSNEKYN